MKMRRKDREVTDMDGIREILDSCRTCHVAMMDGDLPYIVPLSYGYELENGVLTLYFHSAFEGRKIELLRQNSRVCFELCREGEPIHAQTPCNSGYYFSSIIGYGETLFLEDCREKCEALSKMFFRQTGKMVSFTAAQAQSVCVFKIVSERFTGKRKPKTE